MAIDILLRVLLIYLLICLGLFLLQKRLLYIPGGPPTITPADYGLPYDDLFLTTSDGVRIHAWWIPAGDQRGAVLVAHGNAGNIGYRLPIAWAFHNMGLGVLLFDYRGYGRSEGSPSEEGTYRDAEAAWDWLRNHHFPPERIIGYGESIGGAVIIELAHRRKLAAIITEGTLTSVPDLGAEIYWWLPVRLLSRYRYNARHRIASLHIPVLIIHSPDDEIVPFRHAERLFAAANQPKHFLRTTGGHNDGGFLTRREYIDAVREFIDTVLPPAPTTRNAPAP